MSPIGGPRRGGDRSSMTKIVLPLLDWDAGKKHVFDAALGSPPAPSPEHDNQNMSFPSSLGGGGGRGCG